jgi:hypothetical protein
MVASTLERRTDWQSALRWQWRLKHGRHEFQCLIAPETPGFQVRFLFNGRLFSEYMFGSWSDASAFAGQRRSDFESRGYRDPQSKRRSM